MSGTVSTRWYFSDWMSDPSVRACSLAARGLWMDLLCLASANKGTDHGFVMLAGRKLDPAAIARLVGSTESEVETLIEELGRNGVFSRDRRGVIYCRRMVKAEKNRTNGRLGGNPNLLKKEENKNSVQPKPKPHIPEPEPEPLFSNENSTSSVARKVDDWPEDHLAVFWNAYPPYRRTAKKTVAAKLATIRKSGEVTFARLMEGLRRYVATEPGEYAKGPVVWLNGGCWDDVYAGRRKIARPTSNGFAALLVAQQGGNDAEDFFGGDGPLLDAEPVSDRRARHDH